MTLMVSSGLVCRLFLFGASRPKSKSINVDPLSMYTTGDPADRYKTTSLSIKVNTPIEGESDVLTFDG